MGRLFIPTIAVIGIIWKIDPALRPYIDAGITLLFACLMFWLGDVVRGWFDRWEARPYWRKAVRSEMPPSYHCGASMPLIER